MVLAFTLPEQNPPRCTWHWPASPIPLTSSSNDVIAFAIASIIVSSRGHAASIPAAIARSPTAPKQFSIAERTIACATSGTKNPRNRSRAVGADPLRSSKKAARACSKSTNRASERSGTKSSETTSPASTNREALNTTMPEMPYERNSSSPSSEKPFASQLKRTRARIPSRPKSSSVEVASGPKTGWHEIRSMPVRTPCS